MFGDYSYEVAKERIEIAIKAHEHRRLVKQLRLARKGARVAMAARGGAFVMALFK